MALEGSDHTVSFEILGMEDSSCWRLARVVKNMFADPSYQRQGAIWSRQRKQAFIDSLINGFDVPKLYLHEGGAERGDKRYAIVDGKQRLEALTEFYEGRFRLDSNFRLFNRDRAEELGLTSESLEKLPGASYQEIERAVPAVAKYLDQRKLDVRIIRTDDIDVIEELFWRLNEAATLNGPEHRRGIGGPGIVAIDRLVEHEFFRCLPFGDRRYRHQDIAAKFLLWSAPPRLRRATGSTGDIADSKRLNLDRLVREVGTAGEIADPAEALRSAEERAARVLSALAPQFARPDRTLARLGSVALAFLVSLRMDLGESPLDEFPGPEDLRSFDDFREEMANRFSDEESVPTGYVVLQEYDSLAQSSNDGRALMRRVVIFEKYLVARRRESSPLDALAD